MWVTGGQEAETLQKPWEGHLMAIAFQNLLFFRISFFISWEILCPCMQQLFTMCMDAWELAGKGDGHIL